MEDETHYFISANAASQTRDGDDVDKSDIAALLLVATLRVKGGYVIRQMDAVSEIVSCHAVFRRK